MSERIARAQRAQQALDEFIAPILTECRDTYSARMIEIATTELNPKKRADKITALSTGLKVLAAVESGLQAVITDGEIAKRDKLKAEKIEAMSPSDRRLFGLVPTA